MDPKYLCIYCISILLQLSLRNAGSTTQNLDLILNALADPEFPTPPTSLGMPTSYYCHRMCMSKQMNSEA